MNSRSQDRRDRRRQRTRRELAEAAVRLFEERGYAETTVEAIAEAADVSQSTFFRLFPRKEDVLFYDLPERLDAMRSDAATSGDPTAWETIRTTFVSNARTWDDDDNSFGVARTRLFHREPALKTRYLEMCLEWEEAVADVVAAERGTDAHDLYVRVVATTSVSAFRAAFATRISGGGPGIADLLDQAFDVLEAGLPAKS